MSIFISKYKHLLPVIVLAILFTVAYFSHVHDYLNFDFLKQNRNYILSKRDAYPFISACFFCLIYINFVCLALPGTAFLTIVGGFIFGLFIGSLLVIFSATVGATVLFVTVKFAYKHNVEKRFSGWIERLQKGFVENAFSYLLVLRLVPLFPFWVINIVPAIVGINLSTFVLATILGIIPGSIVYVSLGSGLDQLFLKNETPNFQIIFEPKILVPLLALALLSVLPILYQKYFKND